jgi:soluble lytic murein transglycosylase-like protein
MRNLNGTYVHRGDALRRMRRIRQALVAAGSTAVMVVFLAARKTTPASAETVVAESGSSFFSVGPSSKELRQELESTKGELTIMKAQFERADKIIQYSTKYAITAGMASDVMDASLREGIDPELSFHLVRLESEFNPRAVSKVGAVGLTQLMPSTATMFEKGLTREQLFVPKTNLRVGLRYLRTLLDQYKGNVRLALLAYNRGEDAVWRDVRAGVNPGNGYDQWVMKGYKGKGFSQ